MLRERTLTGVALALVYATGCSDALRQRDVAGTFILVAPMPVVISDGVRIRMLADTLRIADDGSAVQRVTSERVHPTTGDTTHHVETSTHTYRLESGAIGLLWNCEPAAVCAGAPEPTWYDIGPGPSVDELRSRESPSARYKRIDRRAP